MKYFISYDEFLFEGKLDTIYTKYYSDIEIGDFVSIVSADPTTIINPNWDVKNVNSIINELINNEDESKVEEITKRLIDANVDKFKKMGNYCKWLLKLKKEDNLLIEDLYKATEYLTAFDKNKHLIKGTEFSNDIFKYKSLPELYNVISKYTKPDSNLKDEKELIENEFYIHTGQATKYYEDNDWLVVIPNDLEASKYYATNSQWCTRFPERFNQYSSQGPLYIFIDKNKLNTKDVDRRMQFHFESKQYMDLNDNSIKIEEFLEKHNYKFFIDIGRSIKYHFKPLPKDNDGWNKFFLTEFLDWNLEAQIDFAKKVDFSEIDTEYLETYINNLLHITDIKKIYKGLTGVPLERLPSIIDKIIKLFNSISMTEKFTMLPIIYRYLDKETSDNLSKDVFKMDNLSKLKYLNSISWTSKTILSNNLNFFIELLTSMSKKARSYALCQLIDSIGDIGEDLKKPPYITILKTFKSDIHSFIRNGNDDIINIPFDQLTPALLERVINRLKDILVFD